MNAAVTAAEMTDEPADSLHGGTTAPSQGLGVEPVSGGTVEPVVDPRLRRIAMDGRLEDAIKVRCD